MRAFVGFISLGLSLSAASAVSAQKISPPEDADMPIAFVSAVTDVCFQMAYQNKLSAEVLSVLDPLARKPAALAGMYPAVPSWYAMKKEPRKIFIGVGDKPNLCHVVIADSKDGRQSFGALQTLLRAGGFKGAWAPDNSALYNTTRPWGASNMLVLLKGLTDAPDGVGPQVSVDIGTVDNDRLRQVLGGK